MMDLQTAWFLLIGVLLVGYAILDGFDLGVGVLHIFARNETERRLGLTSIEPVWDGNEVWLLTGGGAMFAAFPAVYATVFSGYYLAFMLLLAALIFRAVSMEFRVQVDSAAWRRFWDVAFWLGSVVPALLYGVALGNVLRGLPIDAQGNLHIAFLDLLNPYSLLVGVLSLVLFVMHGAIFLAARTEGDFSRRMTRWATGAWAGFVLLYVAATAMSLFEAPHLFQHVKQNPLFWAALVLLLAAMAAVPIFLRAGRLVSAFLASAAIIGSMMALVGVSLYPTMVPSSLDLANYSLTIYNASSTPRTLAWMLGVALVGMPLVLIYTAYVYKIFIGKIRPDEETHY
ncbi:MAG: cytochrome d ubiquinol oxidase subunit II [Pirellulales bacterium]|nr:cytochrome d ubiquinol oxidase subunit II [Pirellulales bacterium]